LGYIVEHECPQCGAPVELEETHRLIHCPYCGVRNFLFTRDYFRFILPHNAPDEDIIYAPYMRFRGNVYFCRDASISHRVVDITQRGLAVEELPHSLGLKPQALKMRLVSPEIRGVFLRDSMKTGDILANVEKNTSFLTPGKLFHRAYIGDALSLIYLPLYIRKNRLFDAVSNQPVADLPRDNDMFLSFIDDNPRWQITFMPTICPHCGWDLDGEKGSVVLTCRNCGSAFQSSGGNFVPVRFGSVTSGDNDIYYLPFWRIETRSEGVAISSYADFIRVTNQPKIVREEWETKNMCFWIPAFKIRPRIFLRLARQTSVSQEDFNIEEKIPKGKLYPVTLPCSEAVQSLKVILASSVMLKKKIFPLLPRVNFINGESTLVYLPFRDIGQEVFQERVRISIQKKTLEFGLRL
jgi:DNA-directed RNA polymerase subunit RPC12/RpoP